MKKAQKAVRQCRVLKSSRTPWRLYHWAYRRVRTIVTDFDTSLLPCIAIVGYQKYLEIIGNYVTWDGSNVQHRRFRGVLKEICTTTSPSWWTYRGLSRYFGHCLACAITTLHRSNRDSSELRYIDWVATPPLLHNHTYWRVAERDGWDHAFYPLAICVVTMIIMGYIAKWRVTSTCSRLPCCRTFSSCYTRSVGCRSC
jgi:hypothetical protein